MVAEHPGVAKSCAMLLLPVHLDDGRVEVDGHRLFPRTSPKRPRPSDGLGDHRVQLADMAEGERPQERAQRGRRHHPEGQHPAGRPGPQPVGMVDVGCPGQDRRHERQHLTAGMCSTDTAMQPHHLVHEGLQAEADHEGGRH